MIKIAKQNLNKRLGVTDWNETALQHALNRLPSIGLQGPWIAGGAVRRTMTGEDLTSDYDFFFRSERQYNEFLLDAMDLGSVLKSSNDMNVAMTFPADYSTVRQAGTPDSANSSLKVQAIKFRFYESIEEVIDSFDYTLAQFGFDGSDVYMSDFALYDVARKKIVPHKITYATSSLRRLLKYGSQGFTACAGALSEILQQVAEKPEIIEGETLYID